MDTGVSACSRAARISPAVGARVRGSWLQKVAYHSRNARRCSSLTQYLELHPVTPQARLIRQAAVIAYPTDSCYALGWHIGDKSALERVQRIRRADRHHHFTLVCADLTE